MAETYYIGKLTGEITKLSQLENDVGFVNHLQINGVELAGNKTSEDLGLMSADASNLSSAGQKVFDGQWVFLNSKILLEVMFMRETYLMKEIREFHNRNIPLVEYPNACKEIRTKINMVADMATNIIKRRYINNEITKDIYNLNINLIEHQRKNYQRQVNSI